MSRGTIKEPTIFPYFFFVLSRHTFWALMQKIFAFEIALFRHNAWNSWFNRELYIWCCWCCFCGGFCCMCCFLNATSFFVVAAMSTQTHTRFRRTKAGSVNFHLQKSVRIIFTLFPCGLVVWSLTREQVLKVHHEEDLSHLTLEWMKPYTYTHTAGKTTKKTCFA